MSRYITQTWPVADLSAVSFAQTVAANGNFILNGTLADPFLPNQISFVQNGFIRGVSITSTNNDSGANFTVTGLQNNIPTTETFVGGNAMTVYGTLSYDVITSITVDADVAGVSIGTGNIGFLPVINMNTENGFIQAWSESIRLLTNPGLTYNLFATIEPIASYPYTYAEMVTNGILFIPVLGNQNISGTQTTIGYITRFLIVQITASNDPLADSAFVSFFQQ